MPKRSRKQPRQTDASIRAFDVVRIATGDGTLPKTPKKNPAAVALGRKGGLKGGHARAAKLTKEQRSESARWAAQARWKARPETDQ